MANCIAIGRFYASLIRRHMYTYAQVPDAFKVATRGALEISGDWATYGDGSTDDSTNDSAPAARGDN